MFRKRLKADAAEEESPSQDRTFIAWGIFLIILGCLFLLQNIIPYRFLSQFWPLIFIFIGVYLVYYSVRKKLTRERDSMGFPSDSREDY
jgi:uncharacterized membrane protein HdeD (DUF308 family)